MQDGAEKRIIGKYEIQGELGRGGMGAVYLAEQPGLGRQVAIKELMLNANLDPTALPRFQQEARVMAKLAHPNLVQVFDLETAGDSSFLIMEYVKGYSLRDLIKQGNVPLPIVFAALDGLLSGLAYAHRNGIIHRDIKPENILISMDGNVKVTDFGIARLSDDSASDASLTKAGTTVGTPQYMSPEQVSSSKVDNRSDIYSAGIIAYELLCGRPPFTATAAEGAFTLMAKHIQAPPPPPTVIKPGLDPMLEGVILKSLAKKPEDRYLNCEEFALALRSVANRLCPGWDEALEPGAQIDKMVPGAVPDGPVGMPAPGTWQNPAEFKPEHVGYAPPPPPKAGVIVKKGPNFKIIGIIAGALVGLIVLGATAALVFSKLNATPTPSPTDTPAATAVPNGGCDYIKLGNNPSTGSGDGRNCPALGSLLLQDNFAGASSLPADLTATAGNIGKVQKTDLTVSGGYARLSAPTKGYVSRIDTSSVTAVNVVTIVDFVPTSSVDANIAIGERCGTTACIIAYFTPKGSRGFTEKSEADTSYHSLFNTDGAAIKINEPNRVVMELGGQRVRVWLNGEYMGAVTTSVDAKPGAISFYLENQDASKPAEVHLNNLSIFALKS